MFNKNNRKKYFRNSNTNIGEVADLGYCTSAHVPRLSYKSVQFHRRNSYRIHKKKKRSYRNVQWRTAEDVGGGLTFTGVTEEAIVLICIGAIEAAIDLICFGVTEEAIVLICFGVTEDAICLSCTGVTEKGIGLICIRVTEEAIALICFGVFEAAIDLIYFGITGLSCTGVEEEAIGRSYSGVRKEDIGLRFSNVSEDVTTRSRRLSRTGPDEDDVEKEDTVPAEMVSLFEVGPGQILTQMP